MERNKKSTSGYQKTVEQHHLNSESKFSPEFYTHTICHDILIYTGTLLISLHDTYLFSLFCLQEFLESSYPWISKILWKCQLLHIFIHQTLARPPSVKIHIILSVLKNCFLFFDFFFSFVVSGIIR